MSRKKYFPLLRLQAKVPALLLVLTMPFSQIAWAQSAPASDQLPVGGAVTAGQAVISQSGANMNIDQHSNRAAIDWQSFDIGSNAHVNFNQPSSNSVALNRVSNGDPSQIFGRLTANGQVFLTNTAGVYFAPGASVNVGGLIATTHTLTNEDFMAGLNDFRRNGSQGAVINEGSLAADPGGYIALLAPEVRNEGVITAQLGTVAMAAGENFQLQFSDQGRLTDITVTRSDIAALVENRHAVVAPGGLVIMSAQAANHLQGGVVKNSGTIEASGMVSDGGIVRLIASDHLELGGTINVDAAAGSTGNGGEVWAIADMSNFDSSMVFSGAIFSRGGDLGGDGGFVETSGSHFLLEESALVNTLALTGKTGKWLIDPYDYTIDGVAAAAIVTSLSSSNVEVTTSANNASYGSNGNNSSTGNIAVNSAIDSNSANMLTLTAANSITVSAAISTGALTLTGPGGITLSEDLTTVTDMTINGNVTLGADVTLTSGISDTFTDYEEYVVPGGVTLLTATLVGGAGGNGGNDGGNQGGSASNAGILTASFDVTGGQTIYIAPGSGGATGASSQGSAVGGAGGTNEFDLGNGGAGGTGAPAGSSGAGGGGGAATVLALTDNPTTGSQLLVAGGGGGGGGSGNNATCPGICGDQTSANYRNDAVMTGQTGYNATNETPPTAGQDGGSSGGGGGGVAGGNSNISVFNTNEWTGRGGNVGSSGAKNSFVTDSLSTSILSGRTNGQDGYAIISYGGGTIDINGTVNGARNLEILARSSDVSISGAIGGGTALTSLNITGASGIDLAGGAVTTTGAQTYTGPLTLNANTTTFTTTSNGVVTFAGDVLKGAGVTSNLAVSSGSGAVRFNGQTGTSADPIGAATITTTGATTLSGAFYATALTKSGSGQTNVIGGLVRTSGGQSYAGVLDLGGDTTLSSTGSGNIVLSGAVSNNNQSDLTINAASGNVTLSGNLAVGTNDRPTPIGDVSITASGTVTMGSVGSPIYADAKSLSITGNSAAVYANNASNFACGTGASATGICLTDSASFNIAAASTLSGPLSGTTTLTKSGAGALDLTGISTYTGNTTVSAGKLEISGTGRLGNGNYAGNIAVTGQVRFNNSVNQTLGGTMSGTGFINSPGSGVLTITTLANADHYNLSTAYVVPSGPGGSSSLYGASPSFSYQLATTAGGGTAVTDADPSGTVVLNGTPNGSSSVGNYTISYASGLTLGSERYTLQAGNNLAWSVAARPLTVTVSKIYDGSASFSSGFTLSGTVNGDALPTLSGSASVASENAGSYASFASSTLTQNNSNYTLTGATVDATISQRALDITVSKTYDGSALFNRGFQLAGMVGGDSAPTVSGTASVANSSAGDYTLFASNNLSLSDANYTVVGGAVTATIVPESPVIPVTTTPTVTIPTINPTTTPELTLPDNRNQSVSQNNAPASVSASPQGNDPSSVMSSTQNGIVVSLVQEPSTQSGGVINVLVPKDMVMRSGGFSFALPAKVIITGTTVFTITKLGGDPLPSWLKFNPETKTFTATAVPAGGLPLSIVISVDDSETTIVVGERP